MTYDMNEAENYQSEAKERWGQTEAYQEYEQKIDKINPQEVQEEMTEIFAVFGQLKDESVESDLVQAQVKSLQAYISEHFYMCTNVILAGLGQMYIEDERFKEIIDHMGGEGTAEFVSRAIKSYCHL